MALNKSLHPSYKLILGGTFNPPHNGHILPLLAVMDLLGFSHATLMPCKVPPHKTTLTTAEHHRLAMLELIVNAYPQLSIEPIELSLPAPSFTVKTLQALREQAPQERLVFVIGYDSWLNLATWHQWQNLASLCHLVVLPRQIPMIENDKATATAQLTSHYGFKAIDDPAVFLDQAQGCVFFAPTECVTISSTQIRQKLTQVASSATNTDTQFNCESATATETFLHPDVCRYINEHGLYQN